MAAARRTVLPSSRGWSQGKLRMTAADSGAEITDCVSVFVADVAVVGMLLFQFGGKGVNVFVFEFRFAEPLHDVQHIQRPTALLD